MKRIPRAKKAGVTRAKKSTSAKKQDGLDNLKLADGKLEVDKVRELEEILGVDQMNVFRTNDLEVFKENISEMTLTDLQTLAAEAGVFPGGNKMALKNRLKREFLSQTKGSRVMSGSQKPILNPGDPRFEELKKLMGEGL